MVQESSYKILSYKIKHNHNFKSFLNDYILLLQRAVDMIWDSIEWIKKQKIPIIPKTREFKRNLRNELLKDWNYAAHYIDSAIKRGFVRVKETLYKFENWKVRITIKPWMEYLEFDLSKHGSGRGSKVVILGS